MNGLTVWQFSILDILRWDISYKDVWEGRGVQWLISLYCGHSTLHPGATPGPGAASSFQLSSSGGFLRPSSSLHVTVSSRRWYWGTIIVLNWCAHISNNFPAPLSTKDIFISNRSNNAVSQQPTNIYEVLDIRKQILSLKTNYHQFTAYLFPRGNTIAVWCPWPPRCLAMVLQDTMVLLMRGYPRWSHHPGH